jgi:peptidyl-prolyl cis-trans isomerase C
MHSNPFHYLITRIDTILVNSLVLFILVLSGGCRGNNATSSPSITTSGDSSPAGSTLTSLPAETTQLPPTAVPTPTETPEPLALSVNGEGVTINEYQAEESQLQEAEKILGKSLPPDQQRQKVLDNLVETVLLAQGAFEKGYKLDDAGLQTELDKLAQQMGGAEALKDWMTQRGYTGSTFRVVLRRQLAAAWQRDQLAAAVPAQAEQVHARQILTIDENIANEALALVKIPGTNFAAYAYRYDPQTGGDLGWFSRGYLTQPEVEEAAFALQPGEISPVIKSKAGYHIIQVIAREPSRPLSPDALRVLQHKAIQDWLKTRRDEGKIDVLLP